MRREVAIVGIGQTEFGKRLPRSAWDLALDAVLAALDDAGIPAAEVDGMCRFTAPFEHVSVPMMVRGLGIPELSYFSESPLGGEALGAVVAHAAGAIVTGQAGTVVIYRAISQSTGGRFGRADQGPGGHGAGTGVVEVDEAENRGLAWPYGLVSPAHLFALWATRYMHVNGLSADDLAQALGSVAIQQRRYANTNPAALMRERVLDRDTYTNARMISWPLRLFDLCLENDGACALVLTSAERAAALRDDPVHVLSATQTLAPYTEPMGLYSAELLQSVPAAVTERLYGRAGIGPEEVSVAEFYDATTFMPMRALENFGFAAPGSGWRHVIEAGIGPDSPLPVNTHGGHLSEGYLHGVNGITEAVRQLRGTACNQVPGAEIALVGAPSGSAMILAR